jgi:hypothetical protein
VNGRGVPVRSFFHFRFAGRDSPSNRQTRRTRFLFTFQPPLRTSAQANR